MLLGFLGLSANICAEIYNTMCHEKPNRTCNCTDTHETAATGLQLCSRDAPTRARVLYVHPKRARYATYCLWYGNDKNATLNYS